jgi:hypothetical protein
MPNNSDSSWVDDFSKKQKRIMYVCNLLFVKREVHPFCSSIIYSLVATILEKIFEKINFPHSMLTDSLTKIFNIDPGEGGRGKNLL